MWKKVLAIFLIGLALFLFQQFLMGVKFPLNIFVIITITLSLVQFPARLPLIILGGVLLDIAYGTYGVNLLTLLILAGIINFFNFYISLDNFWAILILVSGSVIFSLFLYFGLTIIFKLFNSIFNQYFVSLSLLDILFYIVINSLTILIVFLLFKNRLTPKVS